MPRPAARPGEGGGSLADLSVEQVALAETEAFRRLNWPAADRENFGESDPEQWVGRLQAFVARLGAEVVGVAVAKLRGGVGHLSELLVAAPFRGRGVGGALVGAFEAFCWQEGCHKLSLRTPLSARTRPLEFYLKRGWRAEAVHPGDMLGRDWVTLVKGPPGHDVLARVGACWRVVERAAREATAAGSAGRG